MNQPQSDPSVSRPVLFVEDDLNDIVFLKRALGKIHSAIPIQVIGNGRDAWDYLSGRGATERPTRPSLIILDLKLPHMSGLELLRGLKQDPELRRIPVIVMTSSQAQSDIETVYGLGADFYLVKAFDAALSLEYAKGIHAYWRSVCEHPDEPGTDPTLSRLRAVAAVSRALT